MTCSEAGHLMRTTRTILESAKQPSGKANVCRSNVCTLPVRVQKLARELMRLRK